MMNMSQHSIAKEINVLSFQDVFIKSKANRLFSPGRHFRCSEGWRYAIHIRITPTGFSGSLNGGAYIDPDNEASWDYDIVLGSDGKLAFYLRPKPQ
jgi:hypothetical protein